jgi:ABC-type antimicrobial peptide transport system permease subunit
MTAIDPRASIRVAVPLPEEAARQWAAPRFLTGLVSGFAAFAMLLAVLGIYGVTAFSLQQREREVAIRSALGATERVVVGMFLREGGVVVAAGLGVGVAGAAAVGRALGGQLHGVTSLDATTFLAAPILLGAVALLAIWRPAARAARRSPATALGDI